MLWKLSFARLTYISDDVMCKWDSVWMLELWTHVDGLRYIEYDVTEFTDALPHNKIICLSNNSSTNIYFIKKSFNFW